MSNSTYTEEEIESVVKKLSELIFVNNEGIEKIPTAGQVEKMLLLCKKRNRPSYYKLRHASGLSEEYVFKNVKMYSDDGKKMRRFESGF